MFKAEFNKFPKGSLKWLKGIGGLLELDGYNEDLGIAFEYNGPQHYKLEFYMKVYKLSKDVALRRLQRQQQNDQIKKELCIKKGIVLIVIPFDIKYGDIQEYIINEYKRLTGRDVPHAERKDYKNILNIFLKEIQ